MLCGHLDAHLRQIEQRLGVRISNRGNQLQLSGPAVNVATAEQLLIHLYAEVCQGVALSPETLHLQLQEAGLEHLAESAGDESVEPLQIIRTKRASIKPRGAQPAGLRAHIKQYDINFGIGPAGTGKTYLAVACARGGPAGGARAAHPAGAPGGGSGREARLPARRPEPERSIPTCARYTTRSTRCWALKRVNKYIERNIIEVAPLAFMRGRTLNNAFIILDEAQNTTREQMKMFLTRIGFGSTAVITGDATQIDLPRGSQSGLTHATNLLEDVEGLGFTWFGNKDVVRHPLVQRIVSAYDKADATTTLDKSQR